jgi:hypothetical protein
MFSSPINRNVNTLSITASATIGLDVDQVLVDTGAGAVTVTLSTGPGDGAFRQVVVQKTTSDANAVTITDGTFTFSLAAQNDSVICQMTASGSWIGVSGFDPSGSGDFEGPASATDGAPVLFNGTTGKIGKNSTPTGTGNPVLQTSPTLTTPVLGVAIGTSLAASGLITSSSPSAGIGYATGAGGAQTQATDKSTTVVSNTITTAITMNNAALNAGVTVSFTFTNSAIAATDTVICTHQSAGTSGAYTVNAFPGAGSAVISVRNNTAGNLSEAIVLRVTVIKSVSA